MVESHLDLGFEKMTSTWWFLKEGRELGREDLDNC